MAKTKTRKLHKNIVVAYARLYRDKDALCRQVSQSEEGYLYFMQRSGREVPPASSRFLIENGLVEEECDGLFEGFSQTFRPISFDAFERFRSEYEAAPNA